MSQPQTFAHHGILLVHKPVGMSSAHLVSRIKRISKAKKVGHSGTLDPFADGLMIIGINHGTRISRFFLSGDKRYEAEITFGTETDTLDSTGTVTRTCPPDFFKDNPRFFESGTITALLSDFKGPQLQAPPVYSALKQNGVPLYKLARKGTPVQKDARPVIIHDICLKMIEPPRITADVGCSGGTYIRSLAADIGERAGCGAHLSALRRTETCGFSIDNAVRLDDLAEPGDVAAAMISLDEALPDMASFRADPPTAARVRNGITIAKDREYIISVKDAPFVKVVDDRGCVIAILERDKNTGLHNYCCVFHD